MCHDEQYDKAQSAYSTFLDRFASLVLATVGADGLPHASYAPFVVTDNRIFYIFVSELSQHTRDLEHTPQVSIMLIEDERDAGQIFARKRLTLQCQATFVPRDRSVAHAEDSGQTTEGESEWQHAADLFQAKFGGMFDLLRSLADFKMFRLDPQEGWFVLGFGQAYRVAGEALDILVHRRAP